MKYVLIVDADEKTKDLLIDILRSKVDMYFDIYHCGSVKEAILYIREHSLDFIFCELSLPDYSGIRIIKEAHKKSYLIRVIVVTSYSSVENCRLAMKHGACDFITKPFSRNRILSSINTACKEVDDLLQEIKKDEKQSEVI